MASSSPVLDIEAQTNSDTGSQLAINIQSPPPTTHSANLQLPTTEEPQPQDTDTNQHYEDDAARKTTDNSGVQRGMLTFLFQFHTL